MNTLRIISTFLVLAICSLLLPPASLSAEELNLPDLSSLYGVIPGVDIPLSEDSSKLSYCLSTYSDYATIDMIYEDGDHEGSDNSFRELRLIVYYHRDASEVSKLSVFRDLRQSWSENPAGTGPLYLEKWRTESGYRNIETDNPDPNRFSLLFYRVPFGWGGTRDTIYRDNFYIHISCSGNNWGSDDLVLGTFNKAEQYAREKLDALVDGPKPTFTLVYYDPLSLKDIPKDSGIKPGEFIATLKDADGKGISGKTVYFFKDNFSELNTVFRLPAATGSVKNLLTSVPRVFDNVPFYVEDFIYSETDENGIARWNHNESRVLDWDPLIAFRPTQDNDALDGRIFAVIFDKDPQQSYPAGEEAEIEYAAEVNVSFRGVAAITKIGRIDDKKPSAVTAGPPNGLQREVKNTPHYVYKGEEVTVDSNSLVTIQWISGHALVARVNPEVADNGTIYINYKDAGWYRFFEQYVGNPVVEAIVSPAITGLGVYLLALGSKAGALLAGAPVAIAIGVGIGVFEIGKSRYDPLIVKPKSQILIGINDGYSVYTVEGTASLYNLEGETIDVIGGKMVNVSKDGTFGEITGFTESDLNDELNLINQSMNEMNGVQQNSKTGGSSSGPISVGLVIIILVAIVLVAGIVFGISRRRKV